MSIKEELRKYSEFKKYYSHGDPSHDWSHIIRVVEICEKLSSGYEVNFRILTPAAVLHDVVNVPKNSKQRSNASELAANKAAKLLNSYDFSQDEIRQISQIIIEHSYSANLTPSSLESQILQDADKLDSMVAIGIMRWNTVGCKMGASYYDQLDPFAKDRELDDKQFSLDHFETKLLKLYDRLNTENGRIEGMKRLSFMKDFLSQLRSEI